MTSARIVLLASPPALVTPAVAATCLQTNGTAVLEICDQMLMTARLAAATKCWAVDRDGTIERSKVADISWPESWPESLTWPDTWPGSWPENGKTLGPRTAKPLRIGARVELTRNTAANPSPMS